MSEENPYEDYSREELIELCIAYNKLLGTVDQLLASIKKSRERQSDNTN